MEENSFGYIYLPLPPLPTLAARQWAALAGDTQLCPWELEPASAQLQGCGEQLQQWYLLPGQGVRAFSKHCELLLWLWVRSLGWCGGLTLAGRQVPTKAALSLPPPQLDRGEKI